MFFILGGDGKEYGPVSVAKIQEWTLAGRANLQTQARRANDSEWKSLGDFPEFGGTTTAAAVESAPRYEAPSPSPVTYASPVHRPAPVAHRELAGLGARFVAAAIDGFLQFLCKLPLFLAGWTVFKVALQNPQTPPDPEQFTAAFVAAYGQTLPLLGVLAVVQIVLLCVRSQSVGKLIMRLQIVDIREELPGGPLRAFLLRGFIPTLIEFIPLLGLMFWLVDSCFIFREDRRCIHDLIAGTKVVKL